MKKVLCGLLILGLLAGCAAGVSQEIEPSESSAIESSSNVSAKEEITGRSSQEESASIDITDQDIDALKQLIEIEARPTLNGKYCVFAKNNSDFVVDDLSLEIHYLDENGMILDIDKDRHDMVVPGSVVASRMDAPDKYDKVDVVFDIELGVNPRYENHVEFIEVSANIAGDNKGAIIQIKNNAAYDIKEVEYIIVFYDGDDISDISYPKDVMDLGAGKTYSSKETSLKKLDRFEVYLNQAHTFDGTKKSLPVGDGLQDREPINVIFVASQDAQEISMKSTAMTENPESLVVLVKEILKKNFGDNVDVAYDDDTNAIVVSVWADGVAAGATLAATGEPTTLSAWNGMKSNMVDLSSSMKSTIESAGYNNTNVLLNVLNDQNKDAVLLAVLNGIVIYSAVA